MPKQSIVYYNVNMGKISHKEEAKPALEKTHTRMFMIKRSIGMLLIFLFASALILACEYHTYRQKTEIHTLRRRNSFVTEISYPVFHERALDLKVKTVLEDIQKGFMEEASSQKATKGRLAIEYVLFVHKDITHLRFMTQDDLPMRHYVGGRSLHFTKGGDDLSLADFFKDYSSSKKMLSSHLENYAFFEAKAALLSPSKEDVEKAASLSSNLKFFYFDEKALHLVLGKSDLFPGELNVPFYYNKINGCLKEEFSQSPWEKKALYPKRDISKFKNSKVVALTFDDGPSKYTEELLDYLEAKDARATFFVQGYRIKGLKSTILRSHKMGNEIGVHSYNHAQYSAISPHEIFFQQEQTIRELFEITGEYPALTRPPYGEYDQKTLETVDMPIILWNVDPRDWKSHNSKKVSAYCVSKTSDGSIILLHDTSESSVKAAKKVIDELSQEGYAFLTIGEMAEHYGVELKNQYVYRYIKPLL